MNSPLTRPTNLSPFTTTTLLISTASCTLHSKAFLQTANNTSQVTFLESPPRLYTTSSCTTQETTSLLVLHIDLHPQPQSNPVKSLLSVSSLRQPNLNHHQDVLGETHPILLRLRGSPTSPLLRMGRYAMAHQRCSSEGLADAAYD